MDKKWKEIIKNSDDTLEQSIIKFKSHIVSSATIARSIIKDMFDSQQTYYNRIVGRLKSDVQIKFDQFFATLNTERNEYKKKLTPSLADPNNEALFNNLLRSEEEREANESRTIGEYQSQILETEKKVSRVFVSRLSIVAGLLLQLFDKFVTVDDIKNEPGQPTQAKRKTMKELLKEQKRQEMSKQNQTRTWQALTNYSFQQVFFLTSSDPSTLSSRVGSRKKKSIRKSSEKLIDSSDKEPTITLQSNDAQLQRGTIVERNRSYEEYETSMRSRLDSFKDFTITLTNDMTAYQEHWKKCVACLKGTHSFIQDE